MRGRHGWIGPLLFAAESESRNGLALTVGPYLQAESSNESSNGRSVIGGYPQVRVVTPILQNPASDGYFGTRWYRLKRPFASWGTEGREFKSPQPNRQKHRSEHISDLGRPVTQLPEPDWNTGTGT